MIKVDPVEFFNLKMETVASSSPMKYEGKQYVLFLFQGFEEAGNGEKNMPPPKCATLHVELKTIKTQRTHKRL